MQLAFDRTETRPSRWSQDGAEYVRSPLDWCARCSRRLVSLNPRLTAEQALDLSHELSLIEDVRAKSPERVAEDLLRVDVAVD